MVFSAICLCGLSARRSDHRRTARGRRQMRGGSCGLRFGPIRFSRHDGKASGGSPNGSFFRPIPERVRGAVPPCVSGSFENRRRRVVGHARGAAPPCVPGSSENRQRRGVGSRSLRFLGCYGGDKGLFNPSLRRCCHRLDPAGLLAKIRSAYSLDSGSRHRGRRPPRKSGSQQTRRWKEMDSNFQFLSRGCQP